MHNLHEQYKVNNLEKRSFPAYINSLTNLCVFTVPCSFSQSHSFSAIFAGLPYKVISLITDTHVYDAYIQELFHDCTCKELCHF